MGGPAIRDSNPGQPDIGAIIRFDPRDPQVRANPYPHYRWLREHDPIHWGVSGNPNEPGCWYVTRYGHVAAALKEPRLGHELMPLEQVPVETTDPHGAVLKATSKWMFMRDPPAHTRLRGLVAEYFMAGPIAAHAPAFTAIIDRLIDDAAPHGAMDIIADFGKPLSVLTIAGLLGVPAEDRARFIPWTKALSAVIEFDKTEAVMRDGLAAVDALNAYLDDLIAERRADPRDDLISALLSRSDDTPMSDEELKGTCTQLLFGGNEPVTHFMGLGLHALLTHGGRLDAWIENGAFARSGIDELLRYDASVQMTFRTVLEDFDLHGQSVRRGDSVALVFGSANRDPDAYPDADTLKLDRFPNRHLTLGRGLHTCLGANIVRLVGALAFPALIRRLRGLRIAAEPLVIGPSVAVRGFARLPVQFSARPRSQPMRRT